MPSGRKSLHAQVDNPSMQFTRAGSLIKAVRCDDDDRRRHGRLRCEGTRSNLGRVVDLSLSGMQVTRRGGRIVDVGDEFFVELRWDKVVLPLKARVVRVQKSGFSKYTYGLEFVDLDPMTREQLTTISRVTSNRFVIADK